MKQLKQNSSNFKKGDLIYGLFCDRIGIVIDVHRMSDGYQVISVSIPNGEVVLEHECYWIHAEKEFEYREKWKNSKKPKDQD